MIRKEVEKLRGFVFTDEEMKEVIIPATPSKPADEIELEDDDKFDAICVALREAAESKAKKDLNTSNK